jgi:hypothetical protein
MSRTPQSGEKKRDQMADPPAGTPRWAKVFGIIAVVLALVFVVLLLTGVRHGPARHTAPSSIPDHAVEQR